MVVNELRDELEVSGHVIAIKIMSQKDILDELHKIMDGWEMIGYKKPDDVPESPSKERFRELLRALRLKITF